MVEDQVGLEAAVGDVLLHRLLPASESARTLSRLFSLFVSDCPVWYNGFMPRDGTATRERILDAAEHLVIENGYAATSVDQVIAASGTSKGAFFHHFDSKRDLARALVERYVEADLAHLTPRPRSDRRDQRPASAQWRS